MRCIPTELLIKYTLLNICRYYQYIAPFEYDAATYIYLSYTLMFSCRITSSNMLDYRLLSYVRIESSFECIEAISTHHFFPDNDYFSNIHNIEFLLMPLIASSYAFCYHRNSNKSGSKTCW